jgi:transcriptional regulator with GAF, ATPase, and Fis domain
MLANVLEFTRAIFDGLDPKTFQRRFLEGLLSVQNVERGSIWVKRGDCVACIEAAGEQSERILGMEIPLDQPSVAGWVIANARMTVAEPTRDPRHFKEPELGLSAKSTLILCYPLTLKDGTVYGAVELIDTTARGSRLNLRKDYLDLLEHLVAVGSIALGQALAFDLKERECKGLKTALERFKGLPPIVGGSPAVMEAMKKVQAYARTDFPVLITGESGTGKELFAQAIHQSSARRDKPFFVQNCSAIPDTLLESELFGYKKGAFTGADRDKTGLFEAAEGGTVFLDEIGDMAPPLQAKILRLIQNSEVKPLGGASVKNVDVRVISATNKDLGVAIATGEFREDLFYRLNVLPLRLPPLRERPEDVGELLDYFVKRDCLRMGMPAKRLSALARRLLMGYAWPGNIREMENLVKYALTVVEGDVIEEGDLPAHVTGGSLARMAAEGLTSAPGEGSGRMTGVDLLRGAGEGPGQVRGESPAGRAAAVGAPFAGARNTPPITDMTWDDMERAYATELLARTRYNVTKAAKRAGLHRSTFDSRLKRLGIVKE